MSTWSSATARWKALQEDAAKQAAAKANETKEQSK